MALWYNKADAGLIVHSDQGSQYTSWAYRGLLKVYGCVGSMSRYAAQQDILNYIAMFYNEYRLHSTLDDKSPNQYEAEMAELKKVA